MEYWSKGVAARGTRLQDSSAPSLLESRMVPMAKESDETAFVEKLRSIVGLKVKVGEPLARYTTMKIGGPAEYFVEAQTEPALATLLPLLHGQGIPLCLLGNGSNVLISDRGVRGVVLHLSGEFKTVEWDDTEEMVRVRVGAACAVTQLVREAARRGYAGLEFAEGIPGTMGGALVMNAGAYGSEFEKIVDQVDAISRNGDPVHFNRHEMTFTYRDSHMPAGMVVTWVRLLLHKDQATQVSSKVRELVSKRKNSQPSGRPNSGSMFRNPPGDFAGRLIEAAGLKGKRLGQAQISERHANFIVNLGGAKAQDVHDLMELARAEVMQRFSIELLPEVQLLGEWSQA